MRIFSSVFLSTVVQTQTLRQTDKYRHRINENNICFAQHTWQTGNQEYKRSHQCLWLSVLH